MPRKRKLSDLSDRCRLCLARDSCMSELFTDWIRPKLEDLQKCSSIEVLDKPNYPKSICYVCLYKLEMWSQFKTQFLKTNKTIITHFKVIDQPVTESNKILKYETTVDELFSDDNKKRPKIDVCPPELVKPTTETTWKEPDKLVATDPVSLALAKFVEDINSDTLFLNSESNNTSYVSKIEQLNTSTPIKRKVGRPRKIEREASTKRWVERKNALIAATGSVPSESDSDTGSHLSPVQKARAKTNDKDFDKQKKIEKALKNLETNMTDKYKINQEDIINDERKTRSRKVNTDEQQVHDDKLDYNKPIHVEKQLENMKIETEKVEREKEKDVKIADEKPLSTEETNKNNVTEATQNELEIIELDNSTTDGDISQNLEADFKPQLVTSEIVVGNATYVITTVLDVSTPSSSKSDISLKTNGINIDATNQDGRKIDLMNAVQLQRVHPKDDNSFIARHSGTNNSGVQKCLKIEIEGMEVEALQRVQLELAHFINEDVSKRLFDDDLSLFRRSELKPMKFKNSYETLEYQLKTIIEKVLRSNYDSEVLTPSMCSNHQKISHEFVKAAARSPIFQPQVILTRMNLGQLCKMYHVSNLYVLEAVKRQRGLVGPLSRTLGKRRHILPKKYDGFALSMNTGSQDEDENKDQKKLANKLTTNKVQLTGTAVAPKLTQIFIETIEDDASMMTDQTKTAPTIVDIPITVVGDSLINKSTNLLISPNSISNTMLTPLPSLVNRTPAINNTSSSNKLTVNTKVAKPMIMGSTPKPLKRQRHICGICGKELFSKEEAEAHVKNHKMDATSGGSNADGSSSSVKSKPKLMRCKRCQAIVEARHVKSHVCNSIKYNCNLCECTFGVEHLLKAHLETHAQFKIRQEAAAKASLSKTAMQKEKQRVHVVQESNEIEISQPVPVELEITLTGKEPQGYSCFVCDKIFVDEEQMKDHLQMHCEEVSDEGNEKGFQCAFCGEKFQSEESLETHVSNHLHDDSDDKINLLISMDTRRDKQKRSVFKCERCSESFASSLLLATHLPLHEEEDALLVEYEKQYGEQEPHVCTICDEVFDTADELSDHLDVHNGNVHVCILCEKPFSSIRDLQEHVSTHL